LHRFQVIERDIQYMFSLRLFMCGYSGQQCSDKNVTFILKLKEPGRTHTRTHTNAQQSTDRIIFYQCTICIFYQNDCTMYMLEDKVLFEASTVNLQAIERG